MKIVTFNVNGINSCIKKGLLNFMKKENADIYCFQEVKAAPEKVDEKTKNIHGYNSFWSFAEKKGRSGLAIYSKTRPLSVIEGIGNKEFDKEARVLALEFKEFYLVNAYFPHSNRELVRLPFKLKFNKEFSKFCNKLKKPIIIASDFNVAHKEIDLRNPKQNTKNAGFTIEERNWFDSFLKQGYVDAFREFVKEGEHYTWWTYRNNARKRNVGWRIDYFVISNSLKNKLKNCTILKDVLGSDHCPVRLELK